MFKASFWTSASYEKFQSIFLKSQGPCASSNTALWEEITYNPLLIGFFPKLISMHDVGHNMLHLLGAQQLQLL